MNKEEHLRDKESRKRERERKQIERLLSSPASIGQVSEAIQREAKCLASVAFAIEALDELLVEKGVLKNEELMEHLKKVVARKTEQNLAALAARGENV